MAISNRFRSFRAVSDYFLAIADHFWSFIWSQFFRNGHRLSEMVRNVQKRSEMPKNGPKWSEMARNGSQLVRNGLLCSSLLGIIKISNGRLSAEFGFSFDFLIFRNSDTAGGIKIFYTVCCVGISEQHKRVGYFFYNPWRALCLRL